MTQSLPATMLTYAMTTSPNPLEVSASPTKLSPANFTFVVSCPRSVGSCTVSQIAVHLPVGDGSDPTNLTSTPPTIAAASISSSDGAVWTPSLGVAQGMFLFTPPGGSVTIANQSLTIELSGIQMSTLVGTAEIPILEWASAGSAPAPPASGVPSGEVAIPAAKFPTGFFAFGFHPSAGQVNSGESVTLSWVGSSNADFSIKVADQPAVPVSGGSWLSPKLYTATVFTLIASATAGNQTVRLELQAIVTVAIPEVTEFYPVPDEINVGEAVVLHWRAVNADGAYLRTGQSTKQTLPAVSDPEHPFAISPKYGVNYTLQAFKQQGDKTVVSAAVPLSLSFAPVDFETFSANPTTIDAANTSTTISWSVENSIAVTFQGLPVAATGNSIQSPTTTTTYDLVATWLDGSQVSAPPVKVTVLNVHLESWNGLFAVNSDSVTYQIQMTMPNATSVSLSCAAAPFQQKATQVSPNYWTLAITVPGAVPSWFGQDGIPVDYYATGFPSPVSGTIVLGAG